jgi:hypothetical protein
MRCDSKMDNVSVQNSCMGCSSRVIKGLYFFLQEGIRRTIESYPHLRAENQLKFKREVPSKASVYLGSGRGIHN